MSISVQPPHVAAPQSEGIQSSVGSPNAHQRCHRHKSADIVNGAQPPLPAFPVRVACEHLGDAELAGDALRLLRALRAAVGVFYNHTGDLACFSFKQGPNPETGGWPVVEG